MAGRFEPVCLPTRTASAWVSSCVAAGGRTCYTPVTSSFQEFPWVRLTSSGWRSWAPRRWSSSHGTGASGRVPLSYSLTTNTESVRSGSAQSAISALTSSSSYSSGTKLGCAARSSNEARALGRSRYRPAGFDRSSSAQQIRSHSIAARSPVSRRVSRRWLYDGGATHDRGKHRESRRVGIRVNRVRECQVMRCRSTRLSLSRTDDRGFINVC